MVMGQFRSWLFRRTRGAVAVASYAIADIAARSAADAVYDRINEIGAINVLVPMLPASCVMIVFCFSCVSKNSG